MTGLALRQCGGASLHNRAAPAAAPSPSMTDAKSNAANPASPKTRSAIRVRPVIRTAELLDLSASAPPRPLSRPINAAQQGRLGTLVLGYRRSSLDSIIAKREEVCQTVRPGAPPDPPTCPPPLLRRGHRNMGDGHRGRLTFNRPRGLSCPSHSTCQHRCRWRARPAAG
jgi:hypothetical protein